MRARIVAVLAVVAILVVALTTEITRGPGFHRYADTRTWLGIPNAGDVLSNLAFVIVALWAVRDRWRALPYARLVMLGVAAIGIGSAAYHVAPSDTLLAFDWAPIVLTLGILTAAVLHDRAGACAGRIALAITPLFAIGSVWWWLATGGTHGGNMAPYVAVQAAGIALPPLLALVEQGAVRARWLLLGVAGFGVARLFAAYDSVLLDSIGISGHSMKHVAAAVAASCALRALMRR